MFIHAVGWIANKDYFYWYISYKMSLKKIQPPFLRRGDEVAIVSPSWSIDEEKINSAVVFLENWGLKVRTGKNVLKRSGPFAGNDDERLYDLQKMTNDPGYKSSVLLKRGIWYTQNNKPDEVFSSEKISQMVCRIQRYNRPASLA